MTQIKGFNDEHAHSYVLCRFDQCILIDPSHDIERIVELIGDKRLVGILITHAHSDHIHLIGEFKTKIYIHPVDQHLLFEDKYNGYTEAHPYKRKELELVGIEDGMKIPLADQFIEVLHTPGHTKGSCSFLYQDTLFTGDTLFKGSVGRHDLYSGNLSDLRKSVIRLCEMSANIKVYPGHDESSTIRYEEK